MVLVAVVISFSYVQLKNIQTQQTAAYDNVFVNLVRVNEEHAERTFRSVDMALRLMMHRYAQQQDQQDQQNLAAVATAGLIDDKLIAALVIIDSKGIVALSNLPFAKGTDLSDRQHFKVHAAIDTGKLYVSAPVFGRVSKKWSIFLTRRINKPDGSFCGVAVAAIDVAYFTSFYGDLVMPPKSLAVLAGLDGIVRARQFDAKSTIGQNVSVLPMFNMIADGSSSNRFTANSPIDGTKRIHFYRTVPGFPLVVYVSYDLGSVQALNNNSSRILYAQCAVVCLFLVLLAALVSLYVVRLQNELIKRHRMALQLKDSETRLELALQGGELGVWQWNLATSGFTSNTQFFSLLGYPAGELTFSKELLVSLISPKDSGVFFKALRLHLQGKNEQFNNESRFRHKDGRWVWLSVISQVVTTNDRGHAASLSGTAQDVTRRIEASLSLARGKERWDLAVSGSNDGIWDWHVDVGLLYLSGRSLALLGHEAIEADANLTNWTQVDVHPDDAGLTHQLLLRHFKGHTNFYHVECRLRCKNGNYKWILIRGQAVRDAAGRVTRMVGSASDISRHHSSQDQIKDQNERLNTIFLLSPDAFVSFDLAYCVMYTNPAFEQLTGLAAASVLGLHEVEFTKKVNRRCSPTRLLKDMDTMRAQADKKAPKKFELIELVVPSRRVLHAEVQTSGSASVSQIMYLRDVTHETIVEEMKSEFLSTAAHELRTPMASILGFSELLLTHPLDVAQNKEFLNIIYTQSQQMSAILDELLDLARIEARQDKDFVFETLNLSVMVNEVVKGFSLPFGRLAPPVVALPHTSIKADRGKARQVVLNVLSNAYKYSPPEGRVTIAFVASHHKDKGFLCGIRVQDQGCGMTSEQLDRVFERFFRADATGKTPGTGLGMSIAREIMAIHGGEIQVDSVFGVGTAVTVLFPSADPQELQDPADGLDGLDRLRLDQTGMPAGLPHT